jgi:hypothetical protein
VLWVEDYPRAAVPPRWTLFNRDGKVIAEVQMPAHLTVFEIGRDYILGKYIDPAEDIPEIRLYKLRRN